MAPGSPCLGRCGGSPPELSIFHWSSAAHPEYIERDVVPAAGAAHQFSISIGEDPDTRVYIRDGCQDLLLTAVELYLHYLLTI
jgi:hypothetical protein